MYAKTCRDAGVGEAQSLQVRQISAKGSAVDLEASHCR
jgi:hypothetical protein